jgi:hypothetical protein
MENVIEGTVPILNPFRLNHGGVTTILTEEQLYSVWSIFEPIDKYLVANERYTPNVTSVRKRFDLVREPQP